MDVEKDSALILKERIQNREKFSESEIRNYLDNSLLIQNLFTPPQWPPTKFAGIRAILWRLTELSEIPYVEILEETQNLIKILLKYTRIDEGFSLRGTHGGLTACHNTMITKILIRLRHPDKKLIQHGINWILNYQVMARNQKSNWDGDDLYTIWGGCMKSTPCFYGVVKSTITLSEYIKNIENSSEIESKLNEGLNYILKHNLFRKLSDGKPIEPSITLNFYPFTYKTNIIELLALMKQNSIINNPECKDAIKILEKKRRKDGYWYIDKTYMKNSWIEFDIPKQPVLWLTNFIKNYVLPN